jgi:hypothetical protein
MYSPDKLRPISVVDVLVRSGHVRF